MNYKTFLDILILANELNNKDYLDTTKNEIYEGFTFDGSIDRKSIEEAIKIIKDMNK